MEMVFYTDSVNAHKDQEQQGNSWKSDDGKNATFHESSWNSKWVPMNEHRMLSKKNSKNEHWIVSIYIMKANVTSTP